MTRPGPHGNALRNQLMTPRSPGVMRRARFGWLMVESQSWHLTAAWTMLTTGTNRPVVWLRRQW
jgi:hypothetical protein